MIDLGTGNNNKMYVLISLDEFTSISKPAPWRLFIYPTLSIRHIAHSPSDLSHSSPPIRLTDGQKLAHDG